MLYSALYVCNRLIFYLSLKRPMRKQLEYMKIPMSFSSSSAFHCSTENYRKAYLVPPRLFSLKFFLLHFHFSFKRKQYILLFMELWAARTSSTAYGAFISKSSFSYDTTSIFTLPSCYVTHGNLALIALVSPP
jgi:hypothetical protein